MLGGVVSGVNQFRHVIADGDGSKAIANRESLSANTRHAIADCDGCKARATNECITTNTRIICGSRGVL
ncbi:hypothetical protein L6471_05635 [Segatella bryantii]|nr:hypothetical protein [Segatella bryantii]UKK76540.1 hypothetical protein L6471_05635 [Segatella bryantii]UKK81183.1 hypothetical protein L6474_01395 [Segatella bryantii]